MDLFQISLATGEEHLFPISLVRKNEKQIFYLFTRKYHFNETHYLSESGCLSCIEMESRCLDIGGQDGHQLSIGLLRRYRSKLVR